MSQFSRISVSVATRGRYESRSLDQWRLLVLSIRLSRQWVSKTSTCCVKIHLFVCWKVGSSIYTHNKSRLSVRSRTHIRDSRGANFLIFSISSYTLIKISYLLSYTFRIQNDFRKKMTRAQSKVQNV